MEPEPHNDADGWLRIAHPISAHLAGSPVTILDLRPGFALLEHLQRYPASARKLLAFQWQDADIAVETEYYRLNEEFWDGDVKGFVYESELRLVDAGQLETLIAAYDRRIAGARVANREGEFDKNIVENGAILSDLGGGRREAVPGYISFRYRNHFWEEVHTNSPEQPPDGFTVPAYETPEKLRLLCLAYEETDDQGRKMLREFAALSVQKQ
jgi:hypothetical protein